MIAAALAAAVLHATSPLPVDRAAGRRGAAFLEAQAPGSELGVEADTVVALVSAGVEPGAHLVRLRALVPAGAQTPGAAAKAALAAEAAGVNPRCFAGVDLVARIRSGYGEGVYGASVFDDSTCDHGARRRVGASSRCCAVGAPRLRGTGGYGLSLTGAGRDDPDTTGIALMALRAAGAPPSDPAVRGAVRWLLSQRLAGAGWAGAAGTSTVSNSTGLALRGLTAAGAGWPAGAAPALRRLQDPDGGFDATAGAPGSRQLATLDSVPALLGSTLPSRPPRHSRQGPARSYPPQRGPGSRGRPGNGVLEESPDTEGQGAG